MSKLEWVPDAVAPHVKRLADAIGAHVDAVVTAAIDRAIAALAPTPSAPSSPPNEAIARTASIAIDVPGPDLIAENLGPDIAKMLQAPTEPTPRRHRLRPTPAALDAAQERIAARRNGPDRQNTPEPLPVVVSPSASEKATAAYSLAAARAQLAARADARTAKRRAQLAARAKPVDRNPNAAERWSPQELADETEIAEARKPDIFELPTPSSSWKV